MDIEAIAATLGDAHRSGDGWVCRCPAHEDNHASLSLKVAAGMLLWKCHAGCDQTAVREALQAKGLLDKPVERPAPSPKPEPAKAKIVATYDYLTPEGELAYQVCRMEPKSFRQRRKGEDGAWVWNLQGVERLPYNLPTLVRHPMQKAVVVVEGEKDVEALRALGVVATTNAAGAGKWESSWGPRYFRNRTVLIVPDNDDPGWNHACDVWDSLAPVAGKVRVLTLPDVPPKGDVSDWLAAGHTPQDFTALAVAALTAEQAPPVRREIAPPTPKPAPAAIAPEQPVTRQEPAAPPPAPTGAPTPPATRPRPTLTVVDGGNAARQLVPDPDAEFGPEYSDDAVAGSFAGEHADALRYVSHWDKWLVFTGQRWLEDGTREVQARMREHLRGMAQLALRDPNIESSTKRKQTASMLASGGKLGSALGMACADRRLAATVDQWDVAPWSLATPEGTIDLRSGARRPARSTDYGTRTVSTPVADTPYCPTWRSFLATVCRGDKDLGAYLQRVVGYCLTGVTTEHALFFLYGTGGNGKSTFVSTLARLVGDYATSTGMDTFTAGDGDRHPTELARLRGARLVSAQETEEGRRWAESKIKWITGGDPIAARFMRQDFFEFTPQFKLLIAGNHKPQLRNVDEAMKRRFHLIPFTASIPPEARDPDLGSKLLAEGPGILRWAIDGCLAWQARGLQPPEAVVAATRNYMADQDVFGSWLADCCRVGNVGSCQSSVLYKSYAAYCEAAGEFVVSQKRFSDSLESRDFRKRRTAAGSLFDGIVLADQGPGTRHGIERGLLD